MVSVKAILKLKKNLKNFKKQVSEEPKEAVEQCDKLLLDIEELEKDTNIIKDNKNLNTIKKAKDILLLFKSQMDSIKQFEEKYK